MMDLNERLIAGTLPRDPMTIAEPVNEAAKRDAANRARSEKATEQPREDDKFGAGAASRDAAPDDKPECVRAHHEIAIKAGAA
jgi:hypothetical protein